MERYTYKPKAEQEEGSLTNKYAAHFLIEEDAIRVRFDSGIRNGNKLTPNELASEKLPVGASQYYIKPGEDLSYSLRFCREDVLLSVISQLSPHVYKDGYSDSHKELMRGFIRQVRELFNSRKETNNLEYDW